ncbi:unnamed protein product [Musa hybrid cultivar]
MAVLLPQLVRLCHQIIQVLLLAQPRPPRRLAVRYQSLPLLLVHHSLQTFIGTRAVEQTGCGGSPTGRSHQNLNFGRKKDTFLVDSQDLNVVLQEILSFGGVAAESSRLCSALRTKLMEDIEPVKKDHREGLCKVAHALKSGI